LSNLAGGQIN